MRRKLLLLLLIPFSQLFVFTTCDNCTFPQPYFDFTQLFVRAINAKGFQVATLSKQDTLRLDIAYGGNTTALNQPTLHSLFVPAAYAKCPDEGYKGFKYPMEAIDIYSKEGYLTQGASMEKLTDVALFENPYGNDKKYSVQDFMEYLKKNNSDRMTTGMRIHLPPCLTLTTSHSFIIEIRKADGRLVREQTEIITLQ